MKTPHAHAELIKAWADGAEIEAYQGGNSWKYVSTPVWSLGTTYRIKPEPKPDVIYYGVIDMDTGKRFLDGAFSRCRDDGDQLKLTFDGETGELKSAEVL